MSVPLSIVIPTVGRASLQVLLTTVGLAVRRDGGPEPEIVVVDDRPGSPAALKVPVGVTVLRSGGRGPAAARNAGWRAATGEWIAFLDDDVVVESDWLTALRRDLQLPSDVAGSQARLVVPLPPDRRPTDWERGTAGLASSAWITADMAYRRDVLEAVDGFDERFPRAFREDSDLALRVLDAGHRLVRGERTTTHPVRPAARWASLRQQRGNTDDVLMRRRHGRDWRVRAQAPLGRRPQHLTGTGLAVLAVAAAIAGRRRPALAAAGGWFALTAEFAARRILPGPRDRREVVEMLTTSVLIPPAATRHWLAGVWRHRSVPPVRRPLPAAVLVDRDGTLVHDVPYNGDPARVRPLDGVRDALDRLRAAGLPVAVISNQSGVSRGLLTMDQVQAVNERVEELLGPFDGWLVCPHGPADGCDCRKPAPGLALQAAALLGVAPGRCVVIGDIGADMECAAASGARGILVPTAATRTEEVRAARERARTLGQAVDLILAGAS